MKNGIGSLFVVSGFVVSGFAHSGTTHEDVVRWPYAKIPFEIKEGLVGKPAETTWLQAVAHWEQNTNIDFIRTSQDDPNRDSYPRVLRFDTQLAGAVCSSGYFDRGKGQFDPPFFVSENSIGYVDNLTREALDCVIISSQSVGIATHEIGHSVGLIHEHKRQDRADNIFYHQNNLVFGASLAEWSIGDKSLALTPYDYASRLHYDPWQGARGDDTNPLDWVFSLEPPANATPQQIDLSNYLKSRTPDFEDIFRNKTGLSAFDIEAVNKLYANGTADIRADHIDKSAWCSERDFNAGSCAVLRQLSVKSVVANLGPWESGRVTITHTLNPNYNLNDFDMSSLITDAENCQLNQISYCSSGSCTSVAAAARLEQCRAGTLQGCSPHPAIVCEVDSLDPIETIATGFTLIHPDAKSSDYSVIVSSVGSTDDRAHNNAASAKLGVNPSCACNCGSGATQADPTVSALGLIAAAGLVRSRRRKSTGAGKRS